MAGFTPQSLVMFRVAGRRFALDTTAVQRVHRAVEISSLPGVPKGVRGIISVQGEIVPVFDLRALFGQARWELELTDLLMLVRTSWRTVAVLADAVEDVIPCTPEMFVDPETVGAASVPATRIFQHDGEVVLVHDFDLFLSEAERGELAAALA